MSDASEKISMLVAMGFEESAAASALDRCGGHLEQAANHLLGGGGGSSDASGAPPAAAAAPPSSHATATATSSGGGGGGGGGGSSSLSSQDDAVVMVNAPISQYSVDNGRSACTCIALSAAQDFLSRIRTSSSASSIVTSEFLQTAILQGVEKYNAMRLVDPTVEHKSAEEVLQSGAFPSLSTGTIQQGMLSRTSSEHPQSLQGLLATSQDPNEWTCVLITKTPETVLVCLPPTSQATSSSSFILIDSHPRPQQFPGGALEAYARLHSSLSSLVESSLQVIFPYTDLGPDVPELMAAMYNQFDLYRFRYQQAPPST